MVPLKELRTVPEHYLWFLLEGTPPINFTLMNTSTSLKGGLVIKGFQLNRTGTYQYTLLAENEEGSDSKTVEVTVVCKDSILLNFISTQIINNYSSLHEQWCWILFLFYSLVIHFHSVKKKCKNIQTSCPCTLVCFAIVLNTGNLCPLRFVKKKRFTKIQKIWVSSLVNEYTSKLVIDF